MRASKDKDDDDDDSTKSSTAMVPTFMDNKPGTASMREFKDGLNRHLNAKGSETLVNIGFGKLGRIDVSTISHDELLRLHRDLITWNPRARIIELDSYTSRRAGPHRTSAEMRILRRNVHCSHAAADTNTAKYRRGREHRS